MFASSRSVSPFFFQALGSSLLWIFSGRLPISTSLSCSGVLSYFFIRNMFLCHLTLSNFLCGHCFSGCRSAISFASGVCPLVDEVVPGACAGFLLGGTDACPLCMGMVLIPLIGKAISRVCLEAAAHSRWLYAAYVFMSGAVFPPCSWWFSLRCFSTRACQLLGGAMCEN